MGNWQVETYVTRNSKTLKDIGRHFQAKQEKTDLSEDQEGQPEWTGRTRGQGLDADNAEASSVFFRIWYYGRWWTVDYRRAREEGGDEAPGSMLHHCPGLGCGEGTGAEWIYSGSVEGKRVRWKEPVHKQVESILGPRVKAPPPRGIKSLTL